MVNFIAALLLCVGGIKLAGPWTMFVQEHDILFDAPLQDENSKSQGCETKEKIEQEQAAEAPGSISSLPPGAPARYSFESCWYFLAHHEEPVSPPPDIMMQHSSLTVS